MFLDPTPKSAIWTTQWKTWLNDVWGWITGTKWYTPTLLNGWVNYSSTYAPARYRKINGMVEIQGLIKDGTATSGTDLFTLPVGFRPQYQHIFTTMSNSAIARVDVKTDGTIDILNGGSSNWISLSGIMFKAEQ
jgi:hypothetical protein